MDLVAFGVPVASNHPTFPSLSWILPPFPLGPPVKKTIKIPFIIWCNFVVILSIYSILSKPEVVNFVLKILGYKIGHKPGWHVPANHLPWEKLDFLTGGCLWLKWQMLLQSLPEISVTEGLCEKASLLSLLGKFPVFIQCFQHFLSVQMP